MKSVCHYHHEICMPLYVRGSLLKLRTMSFDDIVLHVVSPNLAIKMLSSGLNHDRNMPQLM